MGWFVLRLDGIPILNIGEGEASWVLEGDPQPRGVVSVDVKLMGADDWEIATTQPLPESLRPHGRGASQGTAKFVIIPSRTITGNAGEEQQAFFVEMHLVERLVVHCTVTIGEPQAIDEVAFDLTHLTAQSS